MDWSIAIIVAVGLAALWFWKRSAFVAENQARQLLRKGASVIDVRSPEEFRRSHVPGALNLPLGQVRDKIPQHANDKHQVLLVHCLSGGRSAIATQQLKSLGYRQVFNLGSLARAQRLCAAPRSEKKSAPQGAPEN